MSKRLEDVWALELRAAIADLKLTLALRRFGRAVDELMHKYRPDQPRAPKGTPLGGQWILGAGSGVQGQEGDRERLRAAQIDGSGPIDLLDHENVNGSHTIAEHVGKSDDYLLARTGGGAFQLGPKAVYMYRAGSFTSLASANRLVNSTLALNQSIVLNVARGIEPDAYIVAQFGAPTGREAFRSSITSKPYIRTTTWVGVYIVHDPRFPSGFRVQTAYPRSE